MGRGKDISELRASSERVGKLYPVLLDKYGNIIDGKHRLAVDENWPKVKLEHIETDKQLLITRLVGNVCRRLVSSEEKSRMLGQVGEIYLKEGVAPGEIAYKIAAETGMSYRWAIKYMPAKYKARAGAGGPSKSLLFYESKRNDPAYLYKSKAENQKSQIACLATQEYEQLLGEPKGRILKVKDYRNTDFVNLVIERCFYARLKESAEELKIEPEVIINNIFFLVLRKLEQLAAKENNYGSKQEESAKTS
jgi:hypothetical protein